jgi:flavin reductase (DIM6/NTAB) family NADH-FMN oxidoreductase RutF
MKNNFKWINPLEIKDNVFKAIGDDWMLITAGDKESYNTMTASWGTLGILWNLPVAICFIRPHRYTYIFTEKSSHYTLSFFREEYRDALKFCGSKSGRDYDKAAKTGLIPFSTELGNISFEQSRLILECKKIYADDLKTNNFIIRELINKNYPKKDFHRFYIGEVVNVFTR